MTAPDCGTALALSREGVLSYLNEEIPLEIFPSLTSTNSLLKERAKTGAGEKSVIIALEQTCGRGRQGHTFISPRGGLYMSVLLRPKKHFEDISYITPAAAVAVCEAVEQFCGEQPQIKWVNDVYLSGKKICGILTEGAPSPESGKIEYAVLGIGLNVTAPPCGFPQAIQDTAGALFESKICPQPERLAALVIDRVLALCTENLADTLENYRRRSLLTDKEITVLNGDSPYAAKVLGIDDKYGLIIRPRNGAERTLTCGEVSVRL